MDAKTIVDMLSDRDIFDLLVDLGADPISRGNGFECTTVCHHGTKRKLSYFKDSKSFHCWTNCGHMSIFDLVSNSKEIEFIDALRFIKKKYNLRDDGNHFEGFEIYRDENPGEEILKKLKKVEEQDFEALDENLLQDYYPYYHKLWIDDGISINSMRKFGIRYDILGNQIIIPHYDKNHKLIGVRGRNLNKDRLEAGQKYMPIYHGGKVLKHLTGANLFGLDMNKDKIKELKMAILFESEKSVLQLDSMFPDQSIGLCVSGSSLTVYQLEILKKLEIEEIVIAVDKEFNNIGDEDEKLYASKIEKVFKNKLSPYFRVSVLWDMNNALNLKDSPTDRGKDTFLQLLQNKIYI